MVHHFTGGTMAPIWSAGGVSQRWEGSGGKLCRYNEFLTNGFFFAAAPLPVGTGDGKHLPAKYLDQQMLFYELARALVRA